jgi:uncharacterized membrane protein YedE/YeeE
MERKDGESCDPGGKRGADEARGAEREENTRQPQVPGREQNSDEAAGPEGPRDPEVEWNIDDLWALDAPRSAERRRISEKDRAFDRHGESEKEKVSDMAETKNGYMNPYLAGVLLGLALLASFLILGAGLGASSGMARVGAFLEGCMLPARVQASEYFGKWGAQPLGYYLVFMLAGTFLGGLFSATLARRVSFVLERGRAASAVLRAVFALVGGVIVGFASRLARGCTSGQALTGSALLLTGSLVFMLCIFAGGYAAAWLVRRQWND